MDKLDLEKYFRNKFEIMMMTKISNTGIDNMSYYEFVFLAEQTNKLKTIVSN